ncbi:MAG: hypothetical protein F6K08_28820 [Okeania sp. SIO1H6]|nr:hypothetical protein [Okeania sp. SIO1H6]
MVAPLDFLALISNPDNYYTQVIATGTEWKEAISGIYEIATLREGFAYG